MIILYATSAFMECKISALILKFLAVYLRTVLTSVSAGVEQIERFRIATHVETDEATNHSAKIEMK